MIHWLSDSDMQEDRTTERREKFLCGDAMYFKTRIFRMGALSLYILAALGVLGSWAMGILDVFQMDSDVEGDAWLICVIV